MNFTEPVHHPSVAVGGTGFAAGYIYMWRPSVTVTRAGAG